MISTEGPVLWLAPGTATMTPGVDGNLARDWHTRGWSPLHRRWHGDGILILGKPGRAHSIRLVWRDWSFEGWYVNLEAVWQPARLGFDTEDHTLDLWVASDGSWRWKDEHELAAAVKVGAFTLEEAAAFRDEGERVVAEWPFPTGWEDWRPDPSWTIPVLPEDWDEL